MPLKLPAQLSALRKEERHPVVAGLIALATVAVALGLIAGLFAFVAAGVFGLGGDTEQAAQAADGQGGASLYLPTPKPTASDTGPLITLSSEPLADDSATASENPATETPAQEVKQITLQVGSSTVGSMERIDLSGAYTGGEGAVLQVQRREGGKWTDFPVTASVSGDTFSTYVQTGRTGKQEWRVIDTDSKLASNSVTVTID
ncbi:hypothetical protein [Nocardioides sp. Kera G14]|uniref:hypothetical protein n=1 Tax=Nocardioides sp. Kera G14 TaxID=2884264 RepID=UPI001D126996|nr:hypothetical protein [Nocardioides sp. Kera G14]UDY23211.1 hypothetical protein LH076_14250 [Nocardioides sp. Kera G14]